MAEGIVAGSIAPITFDRARNMGAAELDGWLYAVDLARAKASDPDFQEPP